MALAEQLANDTPAGALLWRPHHARALARLAEGASVEAIRAHEPERPESLARAALRSSVLQVTAIRVLAWMAEERGDDRRALAVMTIAGQRSQRDVASHLWLFRNRLQAGDYDAAYAHGDALMRHAATRDMAAVAMAASAGPDPKATAALVRRLAYGPPWRITLIEKLAAEQNPALVLSILLDLGESGSAATPAESAAFVKALAADGEPQQAYLAWLLLLPEGEYGDLGSVYDGGFEGLPGKGPFVWDFDRQGMTAVLEAPYRTGKALSVRHSERVQTSHAWQLLVLPAGRYRLSVDSFMEDVHDGGQLWWRLYCARGGGELVRLDAEGEPRKWRTLTAGFEVPAAGCASQSLELLGRVEVSGDLVRGWFDRLRIEPADGDEPEPPEGRNAR